MFGYPQYPQQYPQYPQYPQPDYLDQLNRLKQQQAPPQQMQQQSNPDERIWVQGQGAAEAYLVAPNSFVRLWDSQAPVFYEKRADQTGRPFLEVFEYKRKGTDSPTAELSQSSQPINYEERLNALERQMETLRRRVKNGIITQIKKNDVQRAGRDFEQRRHERRGFGGSPQTDRHD